MPGSREEDFKRNNAFSIHDLVLVQLSLLWGHEIYNFGRPFHGHHHYTSSLSETMPRSRAEDFYRNNTFSLYDLYGYALAQEPLPWGS